MTETAQQETTEQLSKRALKRLAKQREQEAQLKGEIAETEEKLVSLEEEIDQEPDAFAEYIQKRIRNLQKRKQRLDKYHEIADLGDASSLNEDQLNALKNKEAVEAPLKEMNEIMDLYKERVAKVAEKSKARDKQWALKVKEEADLARLQGSGVGKEKLDLCVKLLRAVSYKRVVESTAQNETLALEHLLQCVYSGDDSSLEAIDKVYNGADEEVVEGSISYKEVKEIALTPPEKLMGTAVDVEAVEESTKSEDADISAKPKISFLQVEEEEEEEEEDGDDETESDDAALAQKSKPVKNNKPDVKIESVDGVKVADNENGKDKEKPKKRTKKPAKKEADKENKDPKEAVKPGKDIEAEGEDKPKKNRKRKPFYKKKSDNNVAEANGNAQSNGN